MRHSYGNSSERSSMASYAEMPLILTAGMISAYGLIRRKPTLAASAALSAVGLLALKQNAENVEVGQSKQHTASASFAIRCSPERAYRIWRDFENLPRFMPHLESVATGTGGQSRWTALGPLGSRISWNAEIVDDVENERISWRSLPGSQVENRGMIEFRPGPREGGTIATLRMQYLPPGGAIGKAFATFFGRNPEFAAREDLRRFKSLLEAGEIPTTAGQSHGPRGIHGHLMDMLLRETSNMPSPEMPESMRRTA
ncbi:MAG TPA: SRPBCC family protein [Candidatus Sulfotelmatobacter sp.]|jgi:uncharacterized membrane protein|nr:SRPBCC family protein [Candidatus Sulfotelmatobacter sp.]